MTLRLKFDPQSKQQLDSEEGPFITKLRSRHGSIVKRFYLQGGKLITQPSAQIYEGWARTNPAENADRLAEIISALGSNEALALGRLPELGQTYDLATEAKRSGAQISRSKNFLTHHEGRAWMLLDIDTKGLPENVIRAISGRNVVDLLFEAVPELGNAPHLIRPSSSAGITLPDGSSNPVSGYHVYVMVERGCEIPALLQAIHDRLWSLGLGFFVVSKSGSLLDRSLVDTAVDGPERLIFEAAPVVLPPLTRNAPPTIIQNDGKPLRNVAGFCIEKVQQLKDEARALLRPQAKVERKKYEDRQVERIQRQQNIPTAQARRLVRQRLDDQLLEEHDLLEVGPGQFMPVGEFLDRAEGQIGLPCPIEGSEYGLSTAQFYPRNEKAPVPRILSFAHGAVTVFQFARYRSLAGLRWLPASN